MQLLLHYKKLIAMLFLISVLESCMSFKYTFISPGRVVKESLDSHNTAFSRISDSMSTIPKQTYEVIGHGIGSWRYYPMGVNKKGMVYGNGFSNKKTPAKNIIELIDVSIAIAPEMSIELDAHYAPSNHKIKKRYPNDGAYVIHDTPRWHKKALEKEAAIAYLHNNTLQKALAHFVQNNYYKKSKVYIELKATEACIQIGAQTKTCNIQSQKLAKELKEYATNYVRDDGENWLCITSFSPAVLTYFREASVLQDTKNSFDYVLIAGYTGGWPKSAFAQAKGPVPKFEGQIIDFATHTEWLDCVWFSSQGIKNFKTIFNSIVNIRTVNHPTWKPLEFSFSTYQYKQEKMRSSLIKAPKLQAGIRSFMLDLDHKIE